MQFQQMNLVFAYGGNTNPNHLNREFPSHKVVGQFYLPGYQLKFNSFQPFPTEKSLECSYCNIIEHPGSKVHGIVVALSDTDLEKMDKQEFLGQLYERKQVVVQDETTTWSVYTYTMVQPNSCCPPSERYLGVVRRGYKHFSIPEKQIDKAIHEFL